MSLRETVMSRLLDYVREDLLRWGPRAELAQRWHVDPETVRRWSRAIQTGAVPPLVSVPTIVALAREDGLDLSPAWLLCGVGPAALSDLRELVAASAPGSAETEDGRQALEAELPIQRPGRVTGEGR